MNMKWKALHLVAALLGGLWFLAGLQACDTIMGSEDEPWLRVWWVPIDSTQMAEGELGMYLRAYAQPDQEIRWGLLQEWPMASIKFEGTMEAGYLVQIPVTFQDTTTISITFWGGTSTLGPDTIHIDHEPGALH